MAIPLRDINPTGTFPYVSKALVFINIAVFIYELLNPRIIQQYAFVPALAWEEPHRWVTHMFLHGGVLHIVGNMLYLWVFGDNVEDHYGHGTFLLLYLFWGLSAAFSHHVAVETQVSLMTALGYPGPSPEYMPAVGASGAISGVLGAYMVLYPRARILTLILLFVIAMVEVPAWAFIGFWFLYQLFYGALEFITLSQGGVAYFAHIGGFVAGALTALLYRKRVTFHRYWTY